MKRKLLIVANRLPVRFEHTNEGIRIHESEGGLATGLASLNSEYTKEWVGWPGIYPKDEAQQEQIEQQLDKAYHPVFLSEQEINQYYNGFSNETLWPISHYFMKYTHFSNENWKTYCEVNRKFCAKILEVAKEGDIIWVHDYHLMLTPGLLRERLQNTNPIGFFLHIPFPCYELFRTLPWRRELLDGILGAHLVGFHTFEYQKNFNETVYRILGYENRLGSINANGRMVCTDIFPMGINFDKFNDASGSPEVLEMSRVFRDNFGDVKLVLSVDRLDYTKGIIHRLKAFDNLLLHHPELKEKVSLIMLMVPSRDNVEEYKDLKTEVDELVGNTNGRHSSLSWTPIHYFYRSVPFEHLVALYSLADIGLVTPLRDGMNLVAKEYVACKTNGLGVLVLSEMAGSAIELDGAILVNPNDEDAMSQALHKALHMGSAEQKQRLDKMRQQVADNSVERWGEDFTHQLSLIYEEARQIENKLINNHQIAEICANFSYAENRIILLDYDGTLVPFQSNPYEAKPDLQLLNILKSLSEQATVVLVSGRDHFTMEEWFGDLDVQLIAEHGIWYREDKAWKRIQGLNNSWKTELYPVMQKLVQKTPGTFIEEKPFSLAFHYRRADSWMAEIRAPQLISHLKPLCEKHQLQILDGNKVVEVRVAGVDKGSTAYRWIDNNDHDFVMAIGDDTTDEDLFSVMPETAYTIKVGSQASIARLRIRNCEKVRHLLQCMVNYNQLNASDSNSNRLYKDAV